MVTDQGDIRASTVVIRRRDVVVRARASGRGEPAAARRPSTFTSLPRHVRGLPGNLPVLRIPDEWAYYKEDAGKILLGCFEPKAKPWGMQGIREDFKLDSLPEDMDHFMPVLEKAASRMPMLENTGIELVQPRKLYPGRSLFAWRGRRDQGSVCRLRVQFHRDQSSGARARFWPSGSAIVARPWIWSTSKCSACIPSGYAPVSA